MPENTYGSLELYFNSEPSPTRHMGAGNHARLSHKRWTTQIRLVRIQKLAGRARRVYYYAKSA